MLLKKEEGEELLRAAREAISHYFEFNEEPSILKGVDLDKYQEARGVFVTLRKERELRGCIGFPLPLYPLGKAVVKAAIAAAFDDPRFVPLTKEEFGEVELELSVLTVPEKIEVKDSSEYLEKIKVGRDGLIIKFGMNSGLLLPQVPEEQGWGIEEYLDGICMKAGLAPGTWKEKGISLEAFQAQIFEEK